MARLTDCNLDFEAEGAFTGGGAINGTVSSCPRIVRPDNTNPPTCSPEITQLVRKHVTVACDHDRSTIAMLRGTTKTKIATYERSCTNGGSWIPTNFSECKMCTQAIPGIDRGSCGKHDDYMYCGKMNSNDKPWQGYIFCPRPGHSAPCGPWSDGKYDCAC